MPAVINNKKSIVTIRDVARASRVSRMTVSRVVHNNPHVRNETRQRVLSVINRLRYNPLQNIPFVQKVRRGTNAIGLVGPAAEISEESFFTNKAIISFNTIAKVMHYAALQFSDVALYAAVAGGYHEWQKKAQVDGLVFFCPRFDWEPTVKMLHAWGVPMVLVRRQTTLPGIPVIIDNDREGMRVALEHLYGLGHRRIALAGLRLLGREAGLHLEVYQSFLSEKGLPYHPACAYDVAQGTGDRMREWQAGLMKHKQPVTAVLCLDDLIAVEVARMAAHLGMNVPRDLSVVAYDNTSICRLFNPSLTAVNVPVREMLQQAMEVLADIIEGKPVHKSVYRFRNELVVRESTSTSCARRTKN
jgi:LacI family transcriptional regulator